MLVKESMRNAYKVYPISDSDIIWVKVLKDSISMMNDLYVVFVYLLPQTSSYGKVNSKVLCQNLKSRLKIFLVKVKY